MDFLESLYLPRGNFIYDSFMDGNDYSHILCGFSHLWNVEHICKLCNTNLCKCEHLSDVHEFDRILSLVWALWKCRHKSYVKTLCKELIDLKISSLRSQNLVLTRPALVAGVSQGWGAVCGGSAAQRNGTVGGGAAWERPWTEWFGDVSPAPAEHVGTRQTACSSSATQVSASGG